LKKLILNILSFLVLLPISGQELKKATDMLNERGEIYVKLINLSKNIDKRYLGRKLSIDKVLSSPGQHEIYAYLNKQQFAWLKEESFDFEVLTPPSMLKAATMCSDYYDVKGWACYPTYSQYVALIDSFVNNYPSICKLEEFGQSVEGRKLLVLKISDNVNTKEEEPEFFYTSTMHGDETTGYVLMLRLIDYLLSNYGADARVTNLVDNTEIWINPLSNPDGTYSPGDNEISGDANGSTRFNSNGVDLNRNFPDPILGEHPDGEAWQTENIAMMNFLENHNFVLSANFHGGVEVINYPWDSWKSLVKTHADDSWYQEISREYADTVHANSTGYMTYLNNGITNGGDWYVVSGGRQDYVNYYLHGREVTMEISDDKTPLASLLPTFWNYNYRSMLNYINRVHTGFYGKVTDQDGNLLRAKITLKGHDVDSSEVYSDATTGMYYRMIPGGSYTIEASASGYSSAEYEVTAISDSKVEQNFVLQKYPTGFENKTYHTSVVRYQNPITNLLNIDLELIQATKMRIELYDIAGRKVKSKYLDGVLGANKIAFDVSELKPGTYFCKIHSKLGSEELKVVKSSY
jgi:murein tripeptide amidase MpaA